MRACVLRVCCACVRRVCVACVNGALCRRCARGRICCVISTHANPRQTQRRDATNTVLVPLLLRACDSNNPRAQEEVLRSVQRLAQEVQYDVLRGALVPKVGVCVVGVGAVCPSTSLQAHRSCSSFSFHCCRPLPSFQQTCSETHPPARS